LTLKVGEHDIEERTQLGGFSGERWIPEIDIQGFVSILFELLFGSPSQGDFSMPTGIPTFVCTLIESKLHRRSETRYTFDDILETLKQNNFRIEDGVDSAEVSRFVRWVESAELPDK
jgi:hypothetical protein